MSHTTAHVTYYGTRHILRHASHIRYTSNTTTYDINVKFYNIRRNDVALYLIEVYTLSYNYTINKSVNYS